MSAITKLIDSATYEDIYLIVEKIQNRMLEINAEVEIKEDVRQEIKDEIKSMSDDLLAFQVGFDNSFSDLYYHKFF